jgi:hypothetical protein
MFPGKVAMRDSVTSIIHPDELAMLSEVLNEVVRAARPKDEIEETELAVRLTRLLLQQYNAGVTDRQKLKSIIRSAASRTLH